MTELETINYWAFEIDGIERGTMQLKGFGPRSKQILFSHALRENRRVFLRIFLDYYNVPKDLTLQERIAFLQLIGDGA